MPKRPTNQRVGQRSLSQVLDTVTTPVFKRHGFIEPRLITDWHHVVGTHYARFSAPKKIITVKNPKPATVLVIEVHHSALATELSYMQPMILEKIATYFGYRRITSIQIVHAAVDVDLTDAESDITAPKKAVPESTRRHVAGFIDGIDDEDLHDSLQALGEHVFMAMDIE